MTLNQKQSDKIADFLLDIAKGLILGGIGLSTTINIENKLLTIAVSTTLAIFCIKYALLLTEK